jgi:isoprenylcysteine carboxyl methyltransferase (ICMT) family protein YpbQ
LKLLDIQHTSLDLKIDQIPLLTHSYASMVIRAIYLLKIVFERVREEEQHICRALSFT